MQCLQFAGPNKQYLGARVAAGPSNSVVIDQQGIYYIAGKVGVLISSCCRYILTPYPF